MSSLCNHKDKWSRDGYIIYYYIMDVKIKKFSLVHQLTSPPLGSQASHIGNDQANLAVALFEGIEQVLKFTIEVFKERKPNALTVILQWHKLHLI